MSKFLVSVLLTAALVMTPTQKAKANDKAIAAIIIGGLIGAAVLNDQKRKREQEAASQNSGQGQNAPAQRRAPAISAEQRAENRAVQAGLNYFGYGAGVVDGIFGRNTRAATRRYEEDMGFPPDGRLSAQEREFLLESQQRAAAANFDPIYGEILATEGRDGLLQRFRDEELGIVRPTTARATNGALQPSKPEPKTDTGMPVFETGDAARSLNQFCNEMNILTMANGGLTTPGLVKEPDFALNEQFCLARAHAISESNKLAGSMSAEDRADVVDRCKGLADYMEPATRAIATRSPADARREITTLVQASGQTKGQLVTAGRICLGSGFRVDSARIALASAAVLVVSGLPAYSEIISHQLREGLGGVKPDRSKADLWLEFTLAGLNDGETPVLGQKPDRAAVLNEALTGQAAANDHNEPSGNLPVFKLAGGD